jgi:hypothetical protein
MYSRAVEPTLAMHPEIRTGLVLDEDGTFATRCNKGAVELEPLAGAAAETVRALIQQHYDHTRSVVAWRILSGWEEWDLDAALKVKASRGWLVAPSSGSARIWRAQLTASLSSCWPIARLQRMGERRRNLWVEAWGHLPQRAERRLGGPWFRGETSA